MVVVLGVMLALSASVAWFLSRRDDPPAQRTKHIPTFFVSAHDEWHDQLAEGARVEIRTLDPRQEGRQETTAVETLGLLNEQSVQRLVEFQRQVEKRAREKVAQLLTRLELDDPSLDVVTTLVSYREFIQAQFAAGLAETVTRLLLKGDYYTHRGEFPTYLFEEPEFVWTALHGRQHLEGGGVADGVFVPVRIADYGELRALYEANLDLREDHASELCRVFNGKPYAERQRVLETHQTAVKKLRQLLTSKPQTNQTRQEMARVRKDLLPHTIRIDPNRLIATVRRPR